MWNDRTLEKRYCEVVYGAGAGGLSHSEVLPDRFRGCLQYQCGRRDAGGGLTQSAISCRVIRWQERSQHPRPYDVVTETEMFSGAGHSQDKYHGETSLSRGFRDSPRVQFLASKHLDLITKRHIGRLYTHNRVPSLIHNARLMRCWFSLKRLENLQISRWNFRAILERNVPSEKRHIISDITPLRLIKTRIWCSFIFSKDYADLSGGFKKNPIMKNLSY